MSKMSQLHANLLDAEYTDDIDYDAPPVEAVEDKPARTTREKR